MRLECLFFSEISKYRNFPSGVCLYTASEKALGYFEFTICVSVWLWITDMNFNVKNVLKKSLNFYSHITKDHSELASWSCDDLLQCCYYSTWQYLDICNLPSKIWIIHQFIRGSTTCMICRDLGFLKVDGETAECIIVVSHKWCHSTSPVTLKYWPHSCCIVKCESDGLNGGSSSMHPSIPSSLHTAPPVRGGAGAEPDDTGRDAGCSLDRLPA